jgi:hypothetical protein
LDGFSFAGDFLLFFNESGNFGHRYWSFKENDRFPDSPDFENFPDFWTGRDVR